MGNSGSPEYRARQRERERRRRSQSQRSLATAPTESAPASPAGAGDSRARRAAATLCGWCRGPIPPRATGRIPKWCSTSCRHRAWEQSRAAASGRSAIQIVERTVVPAQKSSPPKAPQHAEWVDLLRELTRQLDRGTLYDRDLTILAPALDGAFSAFQRRVRRR